MDSDDKVHKYETDPSQIKVHWEKRTKSKVSFFTHDRNFSGRHQ